jgi:quinoprotein relay system zinc metallohydrolase 2
VLHRLRAAALAAFVALTGAASPLPALQQIAPGVWLQPGVHEDWGPANDGRVANGGFVVGERCVAVIDPGGSVAAGRTLQAEMRRVTSLPVCYVINTHAHPDHVLGTAAFVRAGADAPQVVGHERLAAALGARGPFYLNAVKRDFGEPHAGEATIVAPTLGVRGTQSLDLGGRSLEVTAWPTAHTDADLTVLDLRTRTLWLGDLWFDGHTPVLDGRLKGWLAVLDQLAAQPATLAIPGHGAPSRDWPATLQPQRRYLEKLRDDVRAAVKDGRSLADVVNRIEPDSPRQWKLLDSFHRRNVTAAFAELEWE